MTTRLVHTLTYDADAATSAAMLADPEFREQVCRSQLATSHQVSIEGSPGPGMQVHVQMTLPTDKVPSFAKKIVGTETTLVQTEEWQSASEARVSMAIPGKPGEIRGTSVLAEADGRTTRTVTLDITIKIPLVGGKIEDLISKLLGSALRAEERTAKEYLA
ncbi:DUF2505 domain-containing protein [Nocardioides sp. GY 10113]|uniref:DUF2505 domain-containing protein n=1 Tax=Nocardioides sp. GY 10113 TaxID=2569761 RepID=UPI0010A81E43|nr:DUF2505 domain-containing protein [Nocardioides sp. GY 10113]TIC87336.1 DUF2505 domain-containing protein [Nocardioides sp. GY 10113]